MSFHKLSSIKEISPGLSLCSQCVSTERDVQSEQDRGVSRRGWRLPASGEERTEQRSDRLQNNPGLPKQIGTRLQYERCKDEPRGKESIPPDLPA